MDDAVLETEVDVVEDTPLVLDETPPDDDVGETVPVVDTPKVVEVSDADELVLEVLLLTVGAVLPAELEVEDRVELAMEVLAGSINELEVELELLELLAVLDIDADEVVVLGPELEVEEAVELGLLVATCDDVLVTLLDVEAEVLLEVDEALIELLPTLLELDVVPLELLLDDANELLEVDDALLVVATLLDVMLEELLDTLPLEVLLEVEADDVLVLELGGSLEYISSLPPLPQYCIELLLQSTLQSDVAVKIDPVLGVLPQ